MYLIKVKKIITNVTDLLYVDRLFDLKNKQTRSLDRELYNMKSEIIYCKNFAIMKLFLKSSSRIGYSGYFVP